MESTHSDVKVYRLKERKHNFVSAVGQKVRSYAAVIDEFIVFNSGPLDLLDLSLSNIVLLPSLEY